MRAITEIQTVTLYGGHSVLRVISLMFYLNCQSQTQNVSDDSVAEEFSWVSRTHEVVGGTQAKSEAVGQ